MPHSSGGGSSGGGFHGGSSGGSSNHISTTYFPGARRYRRFYSDGRPDEYVYANSKPGKTGISAVIVLAVMGAIFMAASFFSAFTERAKKLTPNYSDEPAIHDDVGVFDDKDELLAQINQFKEKTGICTAVFTVYDEEWNSDYEDLEKFAFEKYTSNFKDEQHFVIVYSIPATRANVGSDGIVTSSEFKWEAIQGNDTDPIITKSFFDSFGNRFQDELMAGKDPGTALANAFKKANSAADEALNPGSSKSVLKTMVNFIPFLMVSGIFIPILILVIKSYKKDKAMQCEEVPLDVDPVSSAENVSTIPNANGGMTTIVRGPGYYSKGTNYDFANGVTKVTTIISIVFVIPFVVIGIGILAAGLSLMKNGIDSGLSGALIVFGAVWTLLSMLSLFGILRSLKKAKKKAAAAMVDDSDPASEFLDPEEDAEYKRMKRQGYE